MQSQHEAIFEQWRQEREAYVTRDQLIADARAAVLPRVYESAECQGSRRNQRAADKALDHSMQWWFDHHYRVRHYIEDHPRHEAERLLTRSMHDYCGKNMGSGISMLFWYIVLSAVARAVVTALVAWLIDRYLSGETNDV